MICFREAADQPVAESEAKSVCFLCVCICFVVVIQNFECSLVVKDVSCMTLYTINTTIVCCSASYLYED